jgi:hypothetical protein
MGAASSEVAPHGHPAPPRGMLTRPGALVCLLVGSDYTHSGSMPAMAGVVMTGGVLLIETLAYMGKIMIVLIAWGTWQAVRTGVLTWTRDLERFCLGRGSSSPWVCHQMYGVSLLRRPWSMLTSP